MTPKLRRTRSEVPSRLLKKKIKKERTKTPLRFSRRLKKLPPEFLEYYDTIRMKLRQEKAVGRQVISQESLPFPDNLDLIITLFSRPSGVSLANRGVISKADLKTWLNGHKHRTTDRSIQFYQKAHKKRKLHFPRRVKNSKEVVSILSAPKICKTPSKKMFTVPTKVRGSTCKPRAIVKVSNGLETHYTVSKTRTVIKKEPTAQAEKVLKERKKYVLEILNKGDMKAIEKLPSVGSKTAERIILYRQLKGSIQKISELAKMPKFPKRRFHNFVAQNFLKRD